MINLSFFFEIRRFSSWGYSTAKYLSNATPINDTTDTTPPVHIRFPPVHSLHKYSPVRPFGWLNVWRNIYCGAIKTATIMSAQARLISKKFMAVLIRLFRQTTKQTDELPTRLTATISENAVRRLICAASEYVNKDMVYRRFQTWQKGNHSDLKTKFQDINRSYRLAHVLSFPTKSINVECIVLKSGIPKYLKYVFASPKN